jgi:cytochrome b involved in lipid metabolism
MARRETKERRKHAKSVSIQPKGKSYDKNAFLKRKGGTGRLMKKLSGK